MRSILICHKHDVMATNVIARWMASFSELVGILMIDEQPGAAWRRLRAEYRRSGVLGLADVVLFRIHYRLFLRKRDREALEAIFERLDNVLPELPGSVKELVTDDPNSAASRQFLLSLSPDLGVAVCKVLLKKDIFEIPNKGTFVMHPGICPEYRNSHGCFWAMVRRDMDRVGMTLLRIDEGIDTGSVFAYFRYPFDERKESHIVIQNRMTLENLEEIADVIKAIDRNECSPLDTTGRDSNVWGQPRLTSYLKWKRAATRA